MPAEHQSCLEYNFIAEMFLEDSDERSCDTNLFVLSPWDSGLI